ncbi:hypothetical protein BKA70DRAFT_1560818 [Coprinopsis sp. MPI-PUGE-AT-0042]|nr:hypothetical protein BKA70DRAFT_1560818 [Coprinopsis sp. MPI-PUGE-AT-0042]
MDSPSQLSAYLSSNLPLPDNLKSYLGIFLTNIGGSIAELDAEIDQLERVLDAKRLKREQYKQDYEKHTVLQASVRGIPPEIWGIIFGFTLGSEPFGLLEYRTYGYIREVCRTWRDVVAATPGMCRGLVVDLGGPLARTSYNDEGGPQCLRDNLEPLLAIVSRNHPCHLVLGVKDEDEFNWSDEDVTEVVRWILTTAATPTILTLIDSKIFSLVYFNVPRDNRISDLTLDLLQAADRKVFERTPFQEVFPCLKRLSIDASLDFLSPIRHSNLQSLTLTQIHNTVRGISHFLLDCPSLRELQIGSRDVYYRQEDTANPSVPLIHPTLEILVVEGEDLMLLWEHVTFPSLRFLGLSAWGLIGDYSDLSRVLPAFLQRCSLDNKNFTMAFKGGPRKFVLTCSYTISLAVLDSNLTSKSPYQYTEEAPPSPASTQAPGFTEVFCTRRTHDFSWLRCDHVHLPGGKLAKLYIPKGMLKGDEVEEVQDEVGDWGYTPEVLDMDDYKRLLRSSIPNMTLDWQA